VTCTDATGRGGEVPSPLQAARTVSIRRASDAPCGSVLRITDRGWTNAAQHLSGLSDGSMPGRRGSRSRLRRRCEPHYPCRLFLTAFVAVCGGAIRCRSTAVAAVQISRPVATPVRARRRSSRPRPSTPRGTSLSRRRPLVVARTGDRLGRRQWTRQRAYRGSTSITATFRA
jgi:hypothetical protein